MSIAKILSVWIDMDELMRQAMNFKGSEHVFDSYFFFSKVSCVTGVANET